MYYNYDFHMKNNYPISYMMNMSSGYGMHTLEDLEELQQKFHHFDRKYEVFRSPNQDIYINFHFNQILTMHIYTEDYVYMVDFTSFIDHNGSLERVVDEYSVCINSPIDFNLF